MTPHASQAPSCEPLGLIAGEGPLPLMVARGMRRQGRRVCCVGLAGQFRQDLPSLCDEFRVVGVYRIAQWRRALRRMGVREAVMVGRVSKRRMHDPLRLVRDIPDLCTLRLWYRRLRHDRRTPTLLRVIAEELQRGGVTLIDSTSHIPEHMAEPGVMTDHRPTPERVADIAFGWPLLMDSLRLGIGQSLAVRERDVIAVEAVEGTDEMIRRAGELCRRRGWSLLKAAGEQHDRIADVPAVGEQTVRTFAAARGGLIALGAGEVIILNKPATIELANTMGVCIVGVQRDGSVPGLTS